MNEFYDSYLRIERENNKLKFDFSPTGWWFDTTDIAEGVAIILGSNYKNDKKLRNIIISKEDKLQLDEAQALYWLTGGNRVWRFGESYYSVQWDDIHKEVLKDWGTFIKKSVTISKTLGNLIDNLEKFNKEEFQYWMEDNDYITADENE